jgi:outer membrane protein insertion porin family
MKRFAGTTLAILGLTLGIAAGFGIVSLKKFLIQEITTALNEEAQTACGCSIEYDTFTLSFSTLSGKATNLRLIEKGSTKLSFPLLTSRFSIKQILHKVVTLYDLNLSNGFADGVGPDSATFRFINQLTTPLPPELDSKDRWRVELDSLNILGSKLREDFGGSEITAAGVKLAVVRSGENFNLFPEIADLHYRSFNNKERTDVSELPLGKLSASLSIEDERTVFHSLNLGDGSSATELAATVDTQRNDQLSGNSNMLLRSQYIGLPEWLQGFFSGQSQLGGTLGSPRFSGTLTNEPNAPLTISLPNATPLQLSSITGSLDVDVRKGDPIVRLSNIRGTGAGAELSSYETLSFDDAGLSAGFEVTLASFAYGPFRIADGTARISIRPGQGGTVTTFDMRASNLEAQGVSIGPATFKVELTPSAVTSVVDTTDPIQGTFHWEGAISLKGSEPVLERGLLELNRYRYPLAVPVTPGNLSPVELTAAMTLSGPLDMARLKGDGPTFLSFPAVTSALDLKGTTSLKDGVLRLTTLGAGSSARADLTIDIVKSASGTLKFELPETDISSLLPDSNCGNVATTLDYSFLLSQPLGGAGSLGLKTFELGCEPYTIHLPKNLSLPIEKGSLRWKNVQLSGFNTALNLHGEMGISRGLDMALSGDLYLSALLPLLPSIDDLQGRLQTDISLKGPLTDPLLGGSAKLSGGQLGLDSPDIGAHDISGEFKLHGRSITIDKLQGELNSGRFSVQGELLPFDWPLSNLTASLKEVTIAPVQDASITFSGDLTLGLNERKHQALGGVLTVDFAEISKDFDINRIVVQAIAGYFLPTRIRPQVGSTMVDLDLDVKVQAPRNIFVLTPFFSAELNSNIHAGGTTRQPALSGGMQVLTGWVGLKGNRFDITNGAVTFKPGSLTPSIEIASEGMLRTPTGDSILIILEASGPIKSPRISLASDRGLSQDELLLLLTSSRTLAGRTMANRASMQLRNDQRFFLSGDSFSSFTAFFSNLTRIDTLSFEPMYNQFTGTVEPAVVAKKELSSRTSLVGESLFSAVSSSRAGVVHNISPALSINGFSQTVSTQRNPIISSDLTYTILSEHNEFLDISVSGLQNFREDDLLQAARVGGGSRIQNNAESLGTIQRDMVNYLKEYGFLSANVRLECPSSPDYCQQLQISVEEGPLYTIRAVDYSGPELPNSLASSVTQAAKPGDRATVQALREIERKLVVALRNEGYIAARVSPSYTPIDISGNFAADTSAQADLTITIDPGSPISFIFKGNTVFSAAEILDSIDLFSRRRPFGNNTIKLLLQNIEAMYHQKGYLFVEVSYTEDRSDPARLIYRVDIREEIPTKVSSLQITGNNSVPLKRIKVVMKELGYSEQLDLLSPDYAIPAELDALRDILGEVYRNEGFPNVTVNYHISQVNSAATLVVYYSIEEGEPMRFTLLTTKGSPEGITLPTPPISPASLPRVNGYSAQLLDRLKEEGYLSPGISITPGDTLSDLEVVLTPGERTIIGRITVEGLSKLTEETARLHVRLKEGSPYRVEDVSVTKRELLRSGLFSRVDVVATDGALDSPKEDISIRIVERPLNTLEVGTGVNSEFGLHLFGEATDKSLFADGRALSTRVDTYFDQARVTSSDNSPISQGFANVRYLDPSVLGSEYTLTEEARFQRLQLTTQEFDQDRLLFASYLFRQFNSGLAVSAGHSLVFDNLSNVTPDAIISDLDDGSVRLSFLSATASLDRRDDPLIPQSGYTLSLEPKLALAAIGSQANLASLVARSTTVIPLASLSPRFSLGLGASGGVSEPFGSTDEVPITQRFYLGGRATVRGFRENSLGPRGENGAVIGGDTMLAGKSQLQYLVVDSLSTHLFLDTGNVFLRERSFSLGDLRYSTGVGFRYLSPIGPIGFDVGHPLDRMNGEAALRLHFSVGSTF